MTLTHWKKLSNPDYIGSYAFQPGETKTLTIRNVTRENVVGADGKREDCTIVHWASSDKPMILNATNGKMIAKVLDTPYTEEWAGKAIVLNVQKVKAFGEVVEAVRVKNEKVAQKPASRTATTCPDCGNQITQSGAFTAEKIEAESVKRYGVPLCLNCATARKNKPAEPTETKEEVTADENDQNQD